MLVAMRILLVIVLFIVTQTAVSQSNIRFQNSYFLTGQPIFGVGYEWEPLSPFTFGLHLEVGQYASLQQELAASVRQDYSLGGITVYPEVRRYLHKAWREGNHRGVFVGAFGSLSRLQEYSISPVYDDGQHRKGFAAGMGLSAGLRIDTQQSPFYFEFLAGYGRSESFWNNPLSWEDAKKRAGAINRDKQIYRIELAIGYRLNKGSL